MGHRDPSGSACSVVTGSGLMEESLLTKTGREIPLIHQTTV